MLQRGQVSCNSATTDLSPALDNHIKNRQPCEHHSWTTWDIVKDIYFKVKQSKGGGRSCTRQQYHPGTPHMPARDAGSVGTPALGRNNAEHWLGKEEEWISDTKLQPKEHFSH